MYFIIIFGVLAMACLVYFCIIAFYSGLHTSFMSVWLLAILVFGGIAIVSGGIYKRGIRVPIGIKVAIGGVCAICFFSFVAVQICIVSAMSKTPKDDLDYVIVLGAQVRGTYITKSLSKRLEKANAYLNDNPNTIAIVSGGQGEGEDLSEAQCMKNYLVEHGIAANRIIMEDQSVNTNENIEFSMEIIKKISDKEKPEIGIITNNFHVYRTVAVCRKKGYDVCGIGAGSDKILFIHYMVREFFAVVKYRVTGVI